MFDGNFDIHTRFHLLYFSFEILETIDLLYLTGISYPFSERSQKKIFFQRKKEKVRKCLSLILWIKYLVAPKKVNNHCKTVCSYFNKKIDSLLTVKSISSRKKLLLKPGPGLWTRTLKNMDPKNMDPEKPVP